MSWRGWCQALSSQHLMGAQGSSVLEALTNRWVRASGCRWPLPMLRRGGDPTSLSPVSFDRI